MVDPVLVNYVKNCLTEGYKVDQIYAELLDNGYNDDEITYSLKYLKIKDPAIEQHQSLKEESTFKRREGEIQKRNLVNLIKTGYSPEHIQKDLIASGMTASQALDTVSTLISPYKDQLEFIGYYIQSLEKEGFSNKQIQASFRRQNIPEPIVRNVSDPDKIKEIVDNMKREKEMATYHLGILQRIFVVLYNPILNYWIGKKEDKFYRPLIEIFRIQMSLFTAGVIFNTTNVYAKSGFDLANVKWEKFLNELISEFSVYFYAFGYQIASVILVCGLLKVLTFVFKEHITLQECLKILAYSYIPSFIFYVAVLIISNTKLPLLPLYMLFFAIGAILRFNPFKIGINYYLHSDNSKLYLITVLVNLGLIAFELMLGYWNLIISNYA